MTESVINKWNYPTTIYHGEHSLAQVPLILNQNKFTKPVIITDKYFADNNMLTPLISYLKDNNITFDIFAELISDPDENMVYLALENIKRNNNDCIISIGGGTALDLAKTIALLAKHEHHLWEFIEDSEQYYNLSSDLITPMIAIPTTAGTGSEVGRVAMIIDSQSKKKNKTKRFIFHPNLIPDWVILDPLVTVSMPAHLTAATGFDALTHAIEAFCVDSYHPIADGIALQAIKLIKNNLTLAYNQPDNIEARSNMLSAATMAACSFQKGLGTVHSLSHPIGAIYNIHHGLLNAIILPYALEINAAAIENKMTQLSRELSLSSINKNDYPNTKIIIDWITNLRSDLNLPNSLNKVKDHHINIGNLDERDLIISEALADPSSSTNPVTLNTENMKKLLLKSFYGPSPKPDSLR